MELPELGDHCSLEDCGQLDFLPFRCDFCGKTFCGFHREPTKHECEKWTATPTTTRTDGGEKIGLDCAFQSCSGRELTPVLCPSCGLNFCLRHRHPPDHACSVWIASEAERRRKAETKTASTSTGGVPAPKKRPLKSVKARQMAAKVALMKLKLHSSGDVSIPGTERVYFRLLTPRTRLDDAAPNRASTDHAYFFSDQWTLGRAIDFLASRHDFANANNVATARKLRLFRGEDGRRLTPLGRTWKEAISDEEVFSGGTLILEYVDPGEERGDVDPGLYEKS